MPGCNKRVVYLQHYFNSDILNYFLIDIHYINKSNTFTWEKIVSLLREPKLHIEDVQLLILIKFLKVVDDNNIRL